MDINTFFITLHSFCNYSELATKQGHFMKIQKSFSNLCHNTQYLQIKQVIFMCQCLYSVNCGRRFWLVGSVRITHHSLKCYTHLPIFSLFKCAPGVISKMLHVNTIKRNILTKCTNSKLTVVTASSLAPFSRRYRQQSVCPFMELK